MQASVITRSGAEYRYGKRRSRWAMDVTHVPGLRHQFWWIAHNVLAHPLIGVRPTVAAVWFHDWTSRRLNRRPAARRSPMPVIPNFQRWLIHNVAGHVAIGLVPCRATFAWHDHTANTMEVEDWV